MITLAAVWMLIGTSNEPEIHAQTMPSRFDVLEATIDDVHEALRAKRTTCRAIVELYLKRIEA